MIKGGKDRKLQPLSYSSFTALKVYFCVFAGIDIDSHKELWPE
jgi:hypothetical protein